MVSVFLALGTLAWTQHVTGRAVEGDAVSSPRAQVVSSGLAAGEPGSGEQTVREIVDPQTGQRWVLKRGDGHAGRPGRMVPAGGASAHSSASTAEDASAANPDWTLRRPVILAGDRLLVEEHTRSVDAFLEAVALGPSAVGSELSVRLKVGGKVVRAVALGPGRASLEQQIGQRP